MRFSLFWDVTQRRVVQGVDCSTLTNTLGFVTPQKSEDLKEYLPLPPADRQCTQSMNEALRIRQCSSLLHLGTESAYSAVPASGWWNFGWKARSESLIQRQRHVSSSPSVRSPIMTLSQ